MKNKKIIIFVVSIIILAGAIYGIISAINNRSTGIVNTDQVVDSINFSNANINSKDGNYVFEVTLSAKEDINIESFDVTITDKKGKKLDVLSGYVGNITKDETKVVEIETEKDLRKANKVSYKIYSE